MRQMQFSLDLDDDHMFGPACAELAEALVRINMLEISNTPSLPCCLGCGGVRYTLPVVCDSSPTPKASAPPRVATVGFGPLRKRAAPAASLRAHSCQSLLDARGIYAHKRGTCFDLACERAARLRLAGKAATVDIEQRTYAGHPLHGQFHAVVRTAHGVQDPAAELQRNPGQCSGQACNCTGSHT